MIWPPSGTLMEGVNTRTGLTTAPVTRDPRVMEVKMSPVMADAFKPGVRSTSALDDILKPPVTAARAPPSFSPNRVMVIDAVPDWLPVVARTTVVLEAVKAAEAVAFKAAFGKLRMFVTDPKK